MRLASSQSFSSDDIKSRQEWEKARSAVNGIFTGIATPNIQAAINQARNRIDAAYASVQNGEQYVFTLEKQLGVVDRWEPGSSEFQRYQEEAQLQDYRVALDELERLVVQRLFELSKLGMSGTGTHFLVHKTHLLIFHTGYKLRTHIGKALQRRSEAIRNALARYNAQAAKLKPPRPPLTWKEIVDYSFLAEFDLLRQSRFDIRQANWAQPIHREAMVKHFKLLRAREEIV